MVKMLLAGAIDEALTRDDAYVTDLGATVLDKL